MQLKKIAYKIIGIFGDVEVADGFIGKTKEEIILDLVMRELEKAYQQGYNKGYEDARDIFEEQLNNKNKCLITFRQ